MAREVSTREARQTLSDLVNRVHYAKERITLTRNGKAMAAIVTIEDLQALEAAAPRAMKAAMLACAKPVGKTVVVEKTEQSVAPKSAHSTTRDTHRRN